MIAIFSEWTRWSSLGAMLNNNVARAIYALPAAGFVILYSDFFQTLFKFTIDPTSWGFLNFTQRIYMVYYGSIFLLVAFGLFRVSAPRLLRNKRDLQHFVSDIIVSRDSSTVRRIVTDIMAYVDQMGAPSSQSISHKLSGVRSRVNTLGENAGEYESLIPDFLIYYYDWQNSRMPKFRAVLFCLTIFAYGLLILPSIDLFLRVLGTSLRHLVG